MAIMEKRLPKASSYFFSHHSLWATAVAKRPELEAIPSAVFFTHPRPLGISQRELGDALAKASAVISMSSLHVDHLLCLGVPESKVLVLIPGTDFHRFRPHERGTGVVGLCSAYYERKSPERIAEIVSAMPERRFLLVGKGWPSAPIYPRLRAMKNFSYIEAPYEDYPALYERMDVFLSLSELEGGPIPLLEAMACNVVPVATTTGFAPDVIRHGANGFLCEPTDPIEVVASLINRAFALQGDVRATIAELTYDAFAEKVMATLGVGRIGV